jgi:hypothetical protein
MKRILTTLSQKWPEYLLEILVITIGIYGAFTLENWNDLRKQRIEEQVLYSQLLLDYEANLDQLHQKIELHRRCVKSGFAIHAAMDAQTGNLDSLLMDISVLSIDATFDPITHDLGSSGKINLIINPELNRLISNWSSDLAALREMELMWQGRVYGQFMDIRTEMGIERDIQSKFWNMAEVHSDWLLDGGVSEFRAVTPSRITPNIKDILGNKKLEGIIAHGIVMNQGAIEQSLALKKRILRTIELLNQELKK